jgi:hypothetical protein
VKPAELLEFLRDFYRQKASLRQRHVVGARFVSNYDFNNTYQYVINREDVHLSWVQDAIADLAGTTDGLDGPPVDLRPSGTGDDAQRTIIRDDVKAAQAFVDQWRDRVERMSHARNRTMLRVILGETLEQKRFFEQAAAGREDLLGRRANGAGTGGGVLPTRWIE